MSRGLDHLFAHLICSYQLSFFEDFSIPLYGIEHRPGILAAFLWQLRSFNLTLEVDKFDLKRHHYS